VKGLAEFTRTTLVGGLLVVLPVYLSLLLLAKTVAGLFALVSPLTAQIPAEVHFRRILAVLILVTLCFVAGLVVRTGLGLRAKSALEEHLLERIPGYTLLRGLAARMAGRSQDETFAPALVEIEDALVPAFIVDELEDGRYTVFVPSVPTPAAGAVYILARERVHPVAVPLATAVGVISKWGTGAGQLVRAMDTARRPSA
jgi:uncharacterized membrane protein